MAAAMPRISTGVPGLDEHLGGGLLPGTLTVVVGSTGIGKTQLGVSFAAAGKQQDGRPGIVFDMNARGDSQSHREYAERLFNWPMEPANAAADVVLTDFFAADRQHGEYLRIFDRTGRRVSRRELDFDDYQRWHADLARRLGRAIAFFYGNFVQGTRRVVVDGIEPVERASDSIQLELFEYINEQVLRKEHDWLARDLFRQQYLANAAEVAGHAYRVNEITSLLLVTSAENMLEALIERPLEEGDPLATANTLVYMGKVRHGTHFGRGLYIAKHRGSACSEQILPYRITEEGLRLEGF